jgi:hypothetical protein
VIRTEGQPHPFPAIVKAKAEFERRVGVHPI